MTRFIDGNTVIRPIYRGDERPELGVRRKVGLSELFDFSIDGGPDDIVGYETQDQKHTVMFSEHVN